MTRRVEAMIDYVGNETVSIDLKDMDMPGNEYEAANVAEYIEGYLTEVINDMATTGKMNGAVPLLRWWKIIDD